MAAHRAPGFVRRVLAERRQRIARRRRAATELRVEAEHQARIARWKGHRRALAQADQPLRLAGPMPERPAVRTSEESP